VDSAYKRAALGRPVIRVTSRSLDIDHAYNSARKAKKIHGSPISICVQPVRRSKTTGALKRNVTEPTKPLRSPGRLGRDFTVSAKLVRKTSLQTFKRHLDVSPTYEATSSLPNLFKQLEEVLDEDDGEFISTPYTLTPPPSISLKRSFETFKRHSLVRHASSPMLRDSVIIRTMDDIAPPLPVCALARARTISHAPKPKCDAVDVKAPLLNVYAEAERFLVDLRVVMGKKQLAMLQISRDVHLTRLCDKINAKFMRCGKYTIEDLQRRTLLYRTENKITRIKDERTLSLLLLACPKKLTLFYL